MAAKDSNSLVISLSIFVVLTLGLGIAWYMTWSHSDTLTTQLAALQSEKKASDESVRTQNEQITQLKQVIGRNTEDISQLLKDVSDAIAAKTPGTNATSNLEEAMNKAAGDRDSNALTATDRMNQLKLRTEELNANLARHREQMTTMQTALDAKDKQLLDNERTHAEQLGQREKQITELRATLAKTQDEFASYRTDREQLIEEQQKELLQQREALLTLRREKFKLEGITFERPDGATTSVDQNSLTCYIDLGKADELRVGTTFSVYRKNNSGVGRSQSDKDIKGKIEVVELIDDHLAEARIVEQKISDPIANGDPIYSPIFFPGQKLEIAVVGGLEFDGNPGSDRDEFKRIVSNAGAQVVLEVNDEAKLIDGSGNEVTPSDIPSLITSKTRFLLVGDLGDEDTQDTTQREINLQIRKHHEAMLKAAENNGVYLMNLSSFLDYVGYSRKRLVWTPTSRFPGLLPNGSRSAAVNTTGVKPLHTGAEDNAYPSKNRKQLESNGATSGLYQRLGGEDN